MPLYLTHFQYTPEPVEGLIQGPRERADTFRAAAEALGARMISLYYTFGNNAGIVLFEAPDEGAAMAVLQSPSVAASMRVTRTTTLLTAQQMEEVMRRWSMRPARRKETR